MDKDLKKINESLASLEQSLKKIEEARTYIDTFIKNNVEITEKNLENSKIVVNEFITKTKEILNVLLKVHKDFLNHYEVIKNEQQRLNEEYSKNIEKIDEELNNIKKQASEIFQQMVNDEKFFLESKIKELDKNIDKCLIDIKELFNAQINKNEQLLQQIDKTNSNIQEFLQTLVNLQIPNTLNDLKNILTNFEAFTLKKYKNFDLKFWIIIALQILILAGIFLLKGK